LSTQRTVLFLTQIVPYPPDAGPRIKTWNVLRYLKQQGHRVILVSFVREEEEKHLPKLREVVDRVYTVRMKRSRMADAKYLLRSWISQRPFLVERDDHEEMRVLVSRIMVSETIDVVHADQMTMAQFAFTRDGYLRYGPLQKPFVIFDAHNATWGIVERMKKTSPWYMRFLLNGEMARVKNYEAWLMANVDYTLAVSHIDKQMLLETGTSSGNGNSCPPIEVIPIAIDTDQFQPVKRKAGSKQLVTLGTLHYPPNADGIRWFLSEVFASIVEIIPEVKLVIIGKNPPKDFVRLAARFNGQVEITGYVSEVLPYLQDTAAMIIPVRAGGGMRVRILEAFAQGMPVVTTSVGLEGISAVDGRDVLVRDDPQSFAQAVVDLLRSKEQQDFLAKNGRTLVEQEYNWLKIFKRLDGVYSHAPSAPREQVS